MVCGSIDQYLYYCVGVGPAPDLLGDHIYKYDGTNPPTEISWHPPFWWTDEERVRCLYYSPTIHQKVLIITGAFIDPGAGFDAYSRIYMLDPADDSVTLFADWFCIGNYNHPTFGMEYGNNFVTSAIEWNNSLILGQSGGTYVIAIGILNGDGTVTQVWHSMMNPLLPLEGRDQCYSSYDAICGFGYTRDYLYFCTEWIWRSHDGVTWDFFYKTGPHGYFPACNPELGEHGDEDNFEYPSGICQYGDDHFYFTGHIYESHEAGGPNCEALYKIDASDTLVRCKLDQYTLRYWPGGYAVTTKDSTGNPTRVAFITVGGTSFSSQQIRLHESLDDGMSFTDYTTPIDPAGEEWFMQDQGVKFFKGNIYALSNHFSGAHLLPQIKLWKRTGDNTWSELYVYDGYEDCNDYCSLYGASGNSKMTIVSQITVQNYCPPLPEMMQARYQVNVYDTSGKRIALLDNLKDIQIEHTVNSFSTHIISFDGRDTRKSLFGLDYFVEIQRKLYGGSWYTEYIGFHRTAQRQVTEGRHRIFTSYGRSFLDLVNRRCIMYPATTPYTLKGGPGETVIKSYVNENAGPGGNNLVRWNPNGSIGLGIEPNLAQGVYWAGQRTGKNLLEVIQEIAYVTSVDFDVIWQIGTGTFMFRTYYPQRGTDRRITMAFDPLLGNMVTPSYTYSRTEEATVCVVMGSGKGLNRRHLVRQGATLYDSPWNSIEMSKDARNEDSVASYISEGDEALADASPKESFTFEVLQTAASQYGRDYFVGDIVTIRFDDISRVKKIVGATIQMQQGKERIRLEFADLPIFR